VIASTSKSFHENEVVRITGISNDNHTLSVYPKFRYKHLSIVQTIAGRTIDTSAEVGLLSRNVKIRGSLHDEWTGNVENCQDNFEPSQLSYQTCSNGGFGERLYESDGFGVQIMIHSNKKDRGLTLAHFHHIEITHAGQAFRLGRYPINFHMEGNVTGSYIKGCSIHESFNRAITMRQIHNLVVERNVIFNIKGNAYYLVDGIETGNVIRYNLAVYILPSWLTSVDIAPASYWVTNANNIVSHNAAAGSSHFGFLYTMTDGRRYDTYICPRYEKFLLLF